MSTKSTLSQNLEIGKLFIQSFHNIVHLFGPKTKFGHYRERVSACHSLEKPNEQLFIGKPKEQLIVTFAGI